MLSTIRSKFTGENKAPSLAELLASWPAAMAPPRLLGKPKKDPPIETWLAKIAEACTARGVPQNLWHEVGRHFMSDQARARLDEVEKVMRCAYGQRWSWKWASFGVALKNLGWQLNPKKTETVKMEHKSGGWWIIGRGGRDGDKVKTKEVLFEKKPGQRKDARAEVRPQALKKNSRPSKRAKSGKIKQAPCSQMQSSALSRTLTRIAGPLMTTPAPPTTVTAQVPFWLVAASEAIFALTSEYPSTMSVLAAVLITVGSIPALPAVSAGATAHALGSVAVGLGTLLKERALAQREDK